MKDPGRRLSEQLAWVAGLSLCAFVMGCDETWRDAPHGTLEQSIAWSGAGKGWRLWGTGSNGIYAVSEGPTVLDVWRWRGNSMQMDFSTPIDDGILSVAFPSETQWLSYGFDERDKHSYFCLGDLRSGKVLDRWMESDDWSVQLACSSQNGKYVAAWEKPDSNSAESPDLIRIGFVTSDGKTFHWVTTTEVAHARPAIHQVVPSEDGAFIGLAGWDDGLAIVDVTSKKVRWVASYKYRPIMGTAEKDKVPWKAIPFEATTTAALAFSPDSRFVYVGEGMGRLYQFEVATGDTVNTWCATPSGREETGRPIMTVSVSPDGRFVAAGTGPEGNVYLLSTSDGQRRVLKHGGSTILMTSFSPDSKRLASYAAGRIKIWKLPEKPMGRN